MYFSIKLCDTDLNNYIQNNVINEPIRNLLYGDYWGNKIYNG